MILIYNWRNKKLLIITASAIFFILIGFKFNIINFYKEVSSVNHPNVKKDTYVFSTSLKKPKLRNFVIFKNFDSIAGNYNVMFRVLGMPNDTILIENGVVYRNGENMDEHLFLSHSVIVDKTVVHEMRLQKKIISERKIFYKDSFIIELNDEIIKNYGLENQRNLILKNGEDPLIRKVFNESWNKDNFGPIIIDNNKFFVLADNRDDAYDSRYIGLIDDSDIIGTYIFSW